MTLTIEGKRKGVLKILAPYSIISFSPPFSPLSSPSSWHHEDENIFKFFFNLF